MRHILPLACLAILLAPLATAGTPSNPEASDPKGDGGTDILDITGLWVDTGDAQNLTLHLALAAAPPSPPPAGTDPCAQGQCVYTSATYRVFFRVLDPNGNATAAFDDYNSTTV